MRGRARPLRGRRPRRDRPVDVDQLAAQAQAVPARRSSPSPTHGRGRPRSPSGCRPASSCASARSGPGQPRRRRPTSCVNGVVGFAGLRVTLATLAAGRRLALANKESLIAAGPVVQRARAHAGRRAGPGRQRALRHPPVPPGRRRGPSRVARLVLTASGGPFRGRTRAELADGHHRRRAGPPHLVDGPEDHRRLVDADEQGPRGHRGPRAVRRSAGRGVGIGFDQIDVVVHPQSIVHSMVEFTDGATIAQLSMPDMRLPIGYALAYPDRLDHRRSAASTGPTLGRLDFEPPDLDAFPCLGLAYEAGRAGGRPRPGSTPPTRSRSRPSSPAASAGSTSPTCSRPRSTGTMERKRRSADVVDRRRPSRPVRWPREIVDRRSTPESKRSRMTETEPIAVADDPIGPDRRPDHASRQRRHRRRRSALVGAAARRPRRPRPCSAAGPSWPSWSSSPRAS